MLAPMNLSADAKVCDVGAGVAHLTLKLAEKGFHIQAVEPNDNMRMLGQQRTHEYPHVSWSEGTGEVTGQPDHQFDLVSFGSSFNVCDRQKALIETNRILRSQGWFACMWNHRNLDDSLQAQIEATIREFIPEYGYGTRREDQREEIEKSGLFGEVQFVTGQVWHTQSLQDCVTAWRSHGTLHRQAGEKFTAIIDAIEALLNRQNQSEIQIPYETRIWFAQKLA